MICINCKTELDNGAVFCYKCGAKVKQEENMMAQPVATEVSAAQVYAQPQPMAPQDRFANQIYNQMSNQMSNNMQQPYGQQFNYQPIPNQGKKASKAMIPAVIFAILSVITSVVVGVFGFMQGEIGMGLENIAFVFCSVMILIYAASKSGITSIMKGIGFVTVAVFHIIYYGIAAGKEAVTLLGQFFGGNSNANGTDCYYGIALIAGLIFFAIYVLMNIIKGFINSNKASMLMLVSGYFTVLLVVACFIIDVVSDKRGLFAFKFIPVDLGLVMLIIADIFAVITRAKKFEE